jgi:hypothetical protein
LGDIEVKSGDGVYKVDVTSSIVIGNPISVLVNATDTSQAGEAYGCSRDHSSCLHYHLAWTFTEDASITVTSPARGEVRGLRRSNTVTWTTVGTVPSVAIDLYKGDTFIEGCGGSFVNDGSAEIYPGSLVTSNVTEGDDYRVKISDASDPAIYDWSDYFSL